MAEVILANAEKLGVYFLPSKDESKLAQGPMVYGAVKREGSPTIARELIVSFIIDVLAAGRVAWLLLQTDNRSYQGSLDFILVFAVEAGMVSPLPDWNWWGFTAGYTRSALAELVIGWLLAGLVIAKVTTKEQATA